MYTYIIIQIILRKRCVCLYVYKVIFLIQYTATIVIKSVNCKILMETREEAVPKPYAYPSISFTCCLEWNSLFYFCNPNTFLLLLLALYLTFNSME